jgi:hypothetical protein
MFEDFKELLSIFNARQVRYLIVGGYAVSLHAQPRATKDMDLLIKPDAANAAAVFEGLAAFGAPLDGVTSEQFARPGSFFRVGRPPVMVDLLLEIDGVNFDEAWSRRIEVVIDDATGLKAAFISRDDLIAAKLASGRPQDIADVQALRDAAEAGPGD